MGNTCRTSITLTDFSLQYDRPSDFVHSVVCKSPIPYAFGITCVSIYTFTMSVYSGFTSEYKEKIVIWLTYWSYFLLTARFLVTSYNAWKVVFIHREYTITQKRQAASAEQVSGDAEEMPPLYKLQWVLQNISSNSAFIVSALYWIILYSPGKWENVRSINSHAVNTILVLADLLLSRAPVRIHHFIYSTLLIFCYVCFTIIYWAAGGRNHLGEHFIYALLDYSNHPGRACGIFLAVGFVGTPLVQILLYLLFWIRQWVSAHARCPAGKETGTKAIVSGNILSPKEPDSKNARGGGAKNSAVSLIDISIDRCQFDERSHAEEEGLEMDAMAKDDLGNEMGLIHLNAFRPILQANERQISCTDSTKALLS